MDNQLLGELKANFEVGLLTLIDRDQRLHLRRGAINGEKTVPSVYSAVRRRLLELAGLPVRNDPKRRRGEIHLKVGDAERLLRVVRSKDGVVEVRVAVDVVKRAQKAVLGASKCTNIWIVFIDAFCCGGHCSRGAYAIPCAPGSVFIA